MCLPFSWSGWALGLFEQAFVHFVEEAKIVIYFVTNVDFFSWEKLCKWRGSKRRKLQKKVNQQRGSKKRKCQKDDATNTYPSRDLLDLRLMQVGVLIVKVKMVS